MLPVNQTLFGEQGNCFPACISTITGIPLAEIPNFCALYGRDAWFEHYAKWLNERGFAPMSFNYDVGVDPLDCTEVQWGRKYAPLLPWIASGPNSAGEGHCVVFLGDKLFHDPDPGRVGIQRIEDVNFIFPMIRSVS